MLDQSGQLDGGGCGEGPQAGGRHGDPLETRRGGLRHALLLLRRMDQRDPNDDPGERQGLADEDADAAGLDQAAQRGWRPTVDPAAAGEDDNPVVSHQAESGGQGA